MTNFAIPKTIQNSVIDRGWRSTMAESQKSTILSCHPLQIGHGVCQKICHRNLPRDCHGQCFDLSTAYFLQIS